VKKYSGSFEVLDEHFSFPGKTVIDVGCGNGDAARWLEGRGARVTGLDSREMLEKARACPTAGSETYVEGGAQRLPFPDGSADAILYQASFHHVPPAFMADAARECRRVLKAGGRAAFIEPVYQPGAYCEITRLVEDESELIQKAHEAIVSLAGLGLRMEREEFFYLERSFADYIRLIGFFVEDAARRENILARAREITGRLSAAAGRAFDNFRYRSICRLNILAKGARRGAEAREAPS